MFKKKFHISQLDRSIILDSNHVFWISMIKESQKILQPNSGKSVLDFGCGNGKFLQLFDLMDNLKDGLGLELDNELIKTANKNNQNNSIDYKVYRNRILDNYNEYFDVVYSQEVLYTLKDLKNHAEEIFNSLKKGGFYFATMGSHIQNPLWSKRRELIRAEEKYYAYDYSLDEVANIFYEVGFRVGLKRLPLEYFMIYDKLLTSTFSNSLLDLVETTEENKMLFSFWKPTKKS